MIEKAAVVARVEAEYRLGGHQLDWRLLYSPWRTVESAEVAFIGLNPGGGHEIEG